MSRPGIADSMLAQAPVLPLTSLDVLWFQVAGTICNLECTHCFISCSPKNHSFEFLTLADVERSLEQAERRGVKEFYFTGGEPFLNPDLVSMLERTLRIGPATVLTNATVFRPEWLDRLQRAEAESVYALEFRVSIDGPSAKVNDPIRGKGTFDRAMRGVRLLCEAGFLPIVTMTRTWDDSEDESMLSEFRNVLKDSGCTRPRLKLLPRLRIGAEAQRTCGYQEAERLTEQLISEFDTSQLVCSNSRVVTSRGLYVCPILLEAPDARLGDSLNDAETPFPLSHGACFTCYQYGAICSNSSLRVRPTAKAVADGAGGAS